MVLHSVHCVIGCYRVLTGVTCSYTVFMVLHGVILCYMGLDGVTWCYTVSQGVSLC